MLRARAFWPFAVVLAAGAGFVIVSQAAKGDLFRITGEADGWWEIRMFSEAPRYVRHLTSGECYYERFHSRRMSNERLRVRSIELHGVAVVRSESAL